MLWCYRNPSDLLFGAEDPLQSAEGVQQGDPLGPLLFALAIHPLLEHLASLRVDGATLDLLMFYLDDGILAGPAEVVAAAFDFLRREGPRLGLELNLAKCELIVPSGELSDAQRDLFPPRLAASAVLCADFDYLGSPIGSPAHCDAYVARRVAKVRRVLAAVSSVRDAEVAFKIMKSCVNYGRVVHLMRTVPCAGALGSFAAFDDALCSAFTDVTGIYPDDDQWSRVARGVRAGGCGLRSAQRHWPAAFLSSLQATRSACDTLDPVPATLRRLPLPGPALERVAAFAGFAADSSELFAAVGAFNERLPAGATPLVLAAQAEPAQKGLSERLDNEALRADLDACRGRTADLAQLRSEVPERAGDFLCTVPSLVNRLAMRPAEFVVEIK